MMWKLGISLRYALVVGILQLLFPLSLFAQVEEANIRVDGMA